MGKVTKAAKSTATFPRKNHFPALADALAPVNPPVATCPKRPESAEAALLPEEELLELLALLALELEEDR